MFPFSRERGYISTCLSREGFLNKPGKVFVFVFVLLLVNGPMVTYSQDRECTMYLFPEMGVGGGGGGSRDGERA